jgi:hypothetical protein
MAVPRYPDDLTQAIDIIEASFRQIQNVLSEARAAGYNYASVHHTSLGTQYSQLISGIQIIQTRTKILEEFPGWRDYKWALDIAKKPNVENYDKKPREAAAIIQTQTENLLMFLRARLAPAQVSYPQQLVQTAIHPVQPQSDIMIFKINKPEDQTPIVPVELPLLPQTFIHILESKERLKSELTGTNQKSLLERMFRQTERDLFEYSSENDGTTLVDVKGVLTLQGECKTVFSRFNPLDTLDPSSKSVIVNYAVELEGWIEDEREQLNRMKNARLERMNMERTPSRNF